VDKRLANLERRLGPAPDVGRLVIIWPGSWDDHDRDLWERSEILHDLDLHDDLVQKHTGYRPTHRPGVVETVVMPAPIEIEKASEDERATWRAQQGASPWGA